MEINKINGDILGVVVNADIVEGRMVVIDGSGSSHDFGSRTDLPKVKVPTTAEEAKRARFMVMWPQQTTSMPMYQPQPSFPFALRNGGWDQAANLPMTSTTIYTTYPGNQENVAIPSGTPALAFGAGTYTVASGQYIYNASLATPGALLQVSYSGANAGKLEYVASYGDTVVGIVNEYNSTTGKLTFTTPSF